MRTCLSLSPLTWAISLLNSFCLSGVSRETGSMPMDWQYSLASCCSKSLQPNFQVTTKLFPCQKWLGACAAHLAVPPEMLKCQRSSEVRSLFITHVLEDEDPEEADEEKAACLTGAGWGLKAGACWKLP